MEINQELKEIISPDKTALLVWDVQNRLVNNIFNRDIFLSNTKKLVSKAREKQVPVVFSKSTPLPERFESPVKKFLWKKLTMKMTQVPNALDLAIEPLENDIVIPKNTASMFIGTNFEMILRNAEITTIVFTGIATEMGVESSARDASNRGFFPVIITDAVSSFNQEAHKRSLENLASMMILMETKDLVSVW
jgi:nicotinamidase-related amidase